MSEPDLTHTRKDLARRFQLLLNRGLGEAVDTLHNGLQEMIIDNRVRVRREARSAWTISLLQGTTWLEVFYKPTGTRIPAIVRCDVAAQEEALLILRKHMILDDLAEI